MRLFQAASQHLHDHPQGFDMLVHVLVGVAHGIKAEGGELWRLVRPGGQLAITKWLARFWSRAYEIWLRLCAG